MSVYINQFLKMTDLLNLQLMRRSHHLTRKFVFGGAPRLMSVWWPWTSAAGGSPLQIPLTTSQQISES
jgi:hypothetical protein